MTRLVFVLGAMSIIWGITAFAFGTVWADSLDGYEIYLNPGLQERYEFLANLGIFFVALGVLLFAIGYVTRKKRRGLEPSSIPSD